MRDLDRIRWHCRRGLLELDLVLARFLEQRLGELSEAERHAFERLLQCSDNDLWDIVTGRLEPPAGEEGAEAARIVALLRGI
ncbi:MAG: succinate dehydrogenase assembly factor 2 [Burkholderiales bacterium]|nr:succinate dehydrogenase assembly factor 2 [Burkholderiales bacterium]